MARLPNPLPTRCRSPNRSVSSPRSANKPDAVDLPFYVTAHETGHQWWGHQVMSAYVQGATSIDETMAQYTALMVMKHHFGAGVDEEIPALRA